MENSVVYSTLHWLLQPYTDIILPVLRYKLNLEKFSNLSLADIYNVHSDEICTSQKAKYSYTINRISKGTPNSCSKHHGKVQKYKR